MAEDSPKESCLDMSKERSFFADLMYRVYNEEKDMERFRNLYGMIKYCDISTKRELKDDIRTYIDPEMTPLLEDWYE